MHRGANEMASDLCLPGGLCFFVPSKRAFASGYTGISRNEVAKCVFMYDLEHQKNDVPHDMKETFDASYIDKDV
jgi:hypothetical protein